MTFDELLDVYMNWLSNEWGIRSRIIENKGNIEGMLGGMVWVIDYYIQNTKAMRASDWVPYFLRAWSTMTVTDGITDRGFQSFCLSCGIMLAEGKPSERVQEYVEYARRILGGATPLPPEVADKLAVEAEGRFGI